MAKDGNGSDKRKRHLSQKKASLPLPYHEIYEKLMGVYDSFITRNTLGPNVVVDAELAIIICSLTLLRQASLLSIKNVDQLEKLMLGNKTTIRVKKNDTIYPRFWTNTDPLKKVIKKIKDDGSRVEKLFIFKRSYICKEIGKIIPRGLTTVRKMFISIYCGYISIENVAKMAMHKSTETTRRYYDSLDNMHRLIEQYSIS